MIDLVKKHKLIIIIFVVLFTLKLVSNWLLLAENGDTYDFFKIAYFLQNYNLDYASKRMPFLPILLAPFPFKYFVTVGRIWINIFYFFTLIFSYKYFYLISNKQVNQKFVSILFALVIATNILIFENSFYILADTIFLFFNIYYLYLIKKHGLNKPFLLALIATLAFYTRPEGAVLFVITLVLYCIKILSEVIKKVSYPLPLSVTTTNSTIYNLKFFKKIFLNTTVFGFVGLVLIAPYFLRNYYYYGSIFYSGYFKDEAGFLFDKVTLMLRISNFLYAVGGVWLLPTLYILFKSWGAEHKIWHNKVFKISSLGFKVCVGRLNKFKFLPEILVFLAYSLILFIWGPYPRLYTIPTFLILTLTYYLLTSVKKLSIKWFDVFVVLILIGVSTLFYLYIVQFLNQTDFGYRKIGKATAVVFSLPVIMYFYLYSIKKISKKSLITVFTASVILINMFIFIDKFRITRYKYYTIKQAILFATQPKFLGSNIYYSSGSGLETWYLKDFDQRYFYKGSIEPQTFINEATENNVTLYITTEEMGYKDNLSNVSTKKVSGKIIKIYKSPFFPGETKVIRLSN